MILLGTFRQRLCVLSLPVLLGPWMAVAQPTDTFRSWNQPVVPFRIIGNVYYVGASDVTSFLITTPAGHILLEGGFAETAPLIEKNVRELGFKLEDVKILLNSHAHFDHAGGLAELKRLTGARLIVSEPEAEMLARGGRGDFHYGDQLPFPPGKADRIIGDKGEIQLGGVVMTALLTPGHTKGCTTWTMKTTEEGKSYDVVFMGSISIPGYRLTNNTNYPNIAADYARSFKILKALPCDVFLAPHGFVFSLKEKMAGKGGKTNPFIDPQGYRKTIENAEHDYENQLHPPHAKLLNAPPAHPDPSGRFLFYLHGAIVEGSDGRPVSPDYGPYEYQKIIERFADDGFTVISEIRPAKTDPAFYGKKVASWVDQLIQAGIPARNISMVGASKGGVIAAHVSALLRQPDLRFVILAGFFRNLESERNLSLHGRVLSIHDASDVFAIAPDDYFKQSPDLSDGESLVTQTGLGHGLVFQPHPAWYAPAVAWISRDLNEKRPAPR